MSKKKIIFTGGGSTGHVTVNLDLIPYFIEDGWQVEYIGSYNGIERQLVSELENVEYNAISTGKLRRYLDIENVKDIKRVLLGIIQSYKIIKRRRPNIVFSKGGFVSFPVVVGAWLNRIPIILHESDLTLGLANKLCMPFVSYLCTTFEETQCTINSSKAVYIGPIIKESLKNGDAIRGLNYCNFSKSKPVLLVMGGSLGSYNINSLIRENLNTLLQHFQVVHICGKGKVDKSLSRVGYKQFEYIDKELSDIIAMCNIVVSRAGSNSIFEFLFFKKPMILIPLSKNASRGDQSINAEVFRKNGYCEVIEDSDIKKNVLLKTIFTVYENRFNYIRKMEEVHIEGSKEKLIKLIKSAAKLDLK